MTHNSVASLLTLAKDLIATPDRWTQGVSARDVYGMEVDPENPTAKCFCLTGALARARYEAFGYSFIGDNSFGRAHALLPRAVDYKFELSVPKWNDDPNRTHHEVLKALDAAIAKAES